MKNYLILTKVMLKNSGDFINLNIGRGAKSKKISAVAIVLTLIISFGMLEVMMYSGFKSFYAGSLSAGQPEMMPTLIFMSASMVIFMFGILSIPAIFFHATDIEYLLPMPLKPAEILGAKFTVSLVYEYLIASLLILPMLAAMIGHINIIRLVLYGAVILLAVPVLPLAYGAIITLLVFRFTNFGRHRDLTNVIRIVASLALVMVYYVIQSLAQTSGNADQYLQTGIEISSRISFIFPNVIFLGKALSAGLPAFDGLLQMLAGLAIAAAFVVLFMLIGTKMYFKCVVGINQQSTSKKKILESGSEKIASRHSILHSYTKKEISLLFRSPVTMMNCIAINIILPFVTILPFFMSPETSNLASSLDFADPSLTGLALAIVSTACMFMGGMNFVAATCISREGKSFEMMKLIPVKYSTQMNAKVLSGVIIGICGGLLMLVPVTVLLKVPVYLSAIGFVLSLPGTFLVNYICFAVDLNRPTLIWDNEQAAVKQNMNTLIAMVIAVVVAAVPIVLYIILPKNLALYFVVTSVVLCGLLALIYMLIKGSLVKAFNALP